MEKYDSSIETIKHISAVANYLTQISDILKSNADTRINDKMLYLENATLVDLLLAYNNGYEIPSYSETLNSINSNSRLYLKTSETDKNELLKQYLEELQERATNHDKSKLMAPEKQGFDIYTPALKNVEYGSQEYQQYLKAMQKFIQHHYRYNRHHPEHFGNGINGMTIMDLTEMICDWKASSERHATGNFIESIGTINKQRFGYDTEMETILKNTAEKCLIKRPN